MMLRGVLGDATHQGTILKGVMGAGQGRMTGWGWGRLAGVHDMNDSVGLDVE